MPVRSRSSAPFPQARRLFMHRGPVWVNRILPRSEGNTIKSLVVSQLVAALLLVALRAPAAVPAPTPALPATGSGDWPMYGHDPSRTNYNPDETAISRGTVSQLGPVWQANLDNGAAIPYGGP